MGDQDVPATRGNVFSYQDRISIVTTEEPFRWLVAGWRDYTRAGRVSIGYGVLFIVAGLVLTVGLYFAGLEYLIAPLAAGFLLVGPSLTVGLYAISRDLAEGRTPALGSALAAWRANPIPLLAFGLGQVLFLIIWMRLAVVIFAVSFPHQNIDLQGIVNAALFTAEGNVFLLIGTIVGAVLATIAFAVGAFSLPLMLDCRVGIIEAVVTSVVATFLNLRVMALWAALIVVFTAAGLATAYVGLAVTLRLIGHASWHAYRTVIRPPA